MPPASSRAALRKVLSEKYAVMQNLKHAVMQNLKYAEFPKMILPHSIKKPIIL